MKIPILPALLACLALLIGHDATAQKMITFDSQPVHGPNPHKSKYEPGKNSLTIGLPSAINGYTPFYYERTITSFFTIQVGAGITYRSYLSDIAASLYEEGSTADYFNGGLYSDVTDNYASYKHRKSAMGQYFSVSPRFYVHDEALDGGYVGAMFEYKNYRYTAQLADETVDASNMYSPDDDEVPRSGKYLNEYMRCLDFTAQVGGHFQSRSHMSFGWSIGFGVRQASSERLDIGEVRDSYDSNSPVHFANTTRSYSTTKPLFEFNFIMGGWF